LLELFGWILFKRRITIVLAMFGWILFVDIGFFELHSLPCWHVRLSLSFHVVLELSCRNLPNEQRQHVMLQLFSGDLFVVECKLMFRLCGWKVLEHGCFDMRQLCRWKIFGGHCLERLHELRQRDIRVYDGCYCMRELLYW
jgi:hypothetical protein